MDPQNQKSFSCRCEALINEISLQLAGIKMKYDGLNLKEQKKLQLQTSVSELNQNQRIRREFKSRLSNIFNILKSVFSYIKDCQNYMNHKEKADQRIIKKYNLLQEVLKSNQAFQLKLDQFLKRQAQLFLANILGSKANEVKTIRKNSVNYQTLKSQTIASLIIQREKVKIFKKVISGDLQEEIQKQIESLEKQFNEVFGKQWEKLAFNSTFGKQQDKSFVNFTFGNE